MGRIAGVPSSSSFVGEGLDTYSHFIRPLAAVSCLWNFGMALFFLLSAFDFLGLKSIALPLLLLEAFSVASTYVFIYLFSLRAAFSYPLIGAFLILTVVVLVIMPVYAASSIVSGGDMYLIAFYLGSFLLKLVGFVKGRSVDRRAAGLDMYLRVNVLTVGILTGAVLYTALSSIFYWYYFNMQPLSLEAQHRDGEPAGLFGLAVYFILMGLSDIWGERIKSRICKEQDIKKILCRI
jgi:hypothetical protein